jgi:hypothetical protein
LVSFAVSHEPLKPLRTSKSFGSVVNSIYVWGK